MYLIYSNKVLSGLSFSKGPGTMGRVSAEPIMRDSPIGEIKVVQVSPALWKEIM
jgi:hypothetical protein